MLTRDVFSLISDDFPLFLKFLVFISAAPFGAALIKICYITEATQKPRPNASKAVPKYNIIAKAIEYHVTLLN